MRTLATALAVLCTLSAFGTAGAEDRWTVRSGRVTFHFNVDLLRDLGIDLKVEGADLTSHDDEVPMEEPNWTFSFRKGTDLVFHSEYGVVEPSGARSGSLRLNGSLLFTDRASGRQMRLDAIELARGPVVKGYTEEGGADPMLLRSASSKQVFCELISSMFHFSRKDQGLAIHYLNARITESWAQAMGRPELAGWVVGMGEVRAEATLLSSTAPLKAPYQPRFYTGAAEETLDVSLGILSGVQQVGHEGTFPTGKNGIAMSTTSCNLGNVDVPWLAPMQTDHPMIHMALYRLMNGSLEQIGVSWLKHGFFALSSSQCTSCLHPSDGSFLGVHCSDTYAVSNNSDRSYLGPREEANAFTAAWQCSSSHFAGGFPDCQRRHGSGNPHTPSEHRLLVGDADLNLAGATYYYEGYYLIRDDQKLHNNWASRRCTMSWNGSTWSYMTPGTGNAQVEGPAIERWGELRNTVAVDANDGNAVLAVQTTDLGGGVWRYEYALLNMTSDRQIRSFSIPVAGVANLSNIGFHDSDLDPATDWQVTVENGTITWQTETHDVNPDANALEFGYMFNFRFDADAAPTDVNAVLGPFKPGPGGDVTAATRGPISALLAVDGAVAARARVLGARPNPFDHSTTISFATVVRGARLEIYDAAGRHVRNLVDDQRDAGTHAVTWDGHADGGAKVPAGVYYARLRSGEQTAVKSVVVVE